MTAANCIDSGPVLRRILWSEEILRPVRACLLVSILTAGLGCGGGPRNHIEDTDLENDSLVIDLYDASSAQNADTTEILDRLEVSLEAHRSELPGFVDKVEEFVDPRELVGLPCHIDSECGTWKLVCFHLEEFPPFCAPPSCVGGCPAGWDCVLNPQTREPDIEFMCLPAPRELCEPCVLDSDCLAIAGRCVEVEDGGGSFCTGVCDENGTCPEGYVCEYVTGVDPQPVEQCVPLSGVCNGRTPDDS